MQFKLKEYIMKYLFIATAIFMINSCSNSNTLSEESLKSLDNLFSNQYPINEPGAAVLILKGDSIIFNKGYGVADMESMTPINSSTFFNIASVSKQFSAIALMILEEEGKLSLDDKLLKWFPEFNSNALEDITLKHLLSHTSGIPDSRDRSDRLFVTTAKDVESYSYIGELKKLNFQPGTSYEYMNPTYQLMYTIIERASGEKFEDFMRNRIFQKAGMDKTLYFEADRDIPNMSRGYIFNKESGVFDEFDYGEESFFATKADGGIYTSTEEFMKWELALRSNIIVSEKSLKEAHTPFIKTDEPYTYYGFGWFIERKPGYPQKIYHTGDNGGFQIYAGRFPKEKVLYLIFSNRNDRNREANANTLDEILKEAGVI